VLILAGLGALLLGLSQVSGPAAWIVGGLCSLTIGVLWLKAPSDPKGP